MAKFPIYEQQTVPGAVRATGQDFGAGVAQATGEFGGAMREIGLQKIRRENVIDRVQLMNEFDAYGQSSLATLNDTGDISTKATVEQYANGLREKAAEIIGRHSGGASSRAELQAQIENQVGQYTKSANAAQVKAQHVMIGTMVEQKANELAISAGFAPDKITDTFAELDHTIDKLGDAMSPELAAQYKQNGRSRIASNAISRLLTDGQFNTAKSLMGNPEVAKYLDSNAARSFSINIAVDEGKAQAEIQRQDRNVASYTQRLGRNLSPEEVMKIRSLPEKKDMTVSDKIVEFELVTGKPATQDQIDKFYGVDGADGTSSMFGNSLQGRALSFVTENSVAYANGMLSPDQARIFEASVAEAYKPVMRPNPVTGQVEQIQPTIPNFVRQAADQGSRAYGGGSLVSRGAQGSLMPGQTVQYTDPSGRVIGQAVVDANGNFSIKDTNAPQQQGANAGGGTQPPPQGNKTIWEMAPDMAGPVPAVKAALGDMPYLGSMMEGGGETASNRSYIKTQVSQMVDALSINPRNPVALVEMIRKEIDIDPKVMGDPAAYRKRIEGVSRALTERLIEETRAGDDPSLPAKTRQDALDVANTIRNFQKKLMPPMVKNRAELDTLGLESGSKFIDPNGVLRQVP